MGLTSEQRIQYARAVWGNFQDKAKTQREMSSAEFRQISKWMGLDPKTQKYDCEPVPLWCVLRGINDFEGKPRRLEAVVASVERVHAYRLNAVPRGDE